VLDFDNLVVEFGKDVKKNLEGNEGEPEAQLTTPVSHFLKGFGDFPSPPAAPPRTPPRGGGGGG